MNSPTTGALLARDKIDRYRSFGAFGKPAYQSYVQMRAMLRSKKGDWLANYFAKPTYDPDTNELRWTAEVPGAVRSLHQLQGEEFQRGVEALDGIHKQLEQFVRDLRQQGAASGAPAQPGGAAAFASLLEQAMKVPTGGDFLFFVGEQPVIAFWGFSDPDGRCVDPALLAPRMAAAPAVAEPVAAAVPLPVEEKRKRPWWWWLLWLLLALLLIALLLLLPRACVPGGGLDLKRAIPGMAPPDGAASEPERRGEGPGMPPQPGAPGGPGGPNGPGPDGGPPPGNPPGAEPPPPSASQPGMELPPDAKDPKTEPPPPPDDKNPKTDPPVPPEQKDPNKDPAKDPKDPAKDPKDPKNKTNPPLPPKDKDMKMPDDPNAQKKMDFLEGQWKAGEGLIDKKTQQPLDLGFKFGKDGQGEVSVRRPDGVTCQGPVSGRMVDGKLGIQGNQSIPCSNGTSYGAPKIECQKERSGQTQCYGVNADGSRYYMGMQRQ